MRRGDDTPDKTHFRLSFYEKTKTHRRDKTKTKIVLATLNFLFAIK